VAEARRLHDLEVLLVLRGGAYGDFIEPLAGSQLLERVPAVERIEELVVATPACVGHEAAHRERVDQLVIKLLVGDGFGRGDHWLPAGCGNDRKGFRVDAQVFLRRLGEEGFRIDRARQVHVQVRALGEIF